MEVISVAKVINNIIGDIGVQRKRLDELAKHKARTEANYQKTITTTMVALRTGQKFTIEKEEQVGCTSETNLKKTAEGVCSELLYDKLVAESGYKNCIVNIECLKSQLNAKQSILRYLENE